MQTINQRVTETSDGKKKARLYNSDNTTRHAENGGKKRETAVTVEKIYEKSDRGTLGGKREGIDCG